MGLMLAAATVGNQKLLLHYIFLGGKAGVKGRNAYDTARPTGGVHAELATDM